MPSFHPAARRAKEIVESGELGDITDIQATMALTSGFFKDSDIRFSYGLGGGSLMDMGCTDHLLARKSHYADMI